MNFRSTYILLAIAGLMLVLLVPKVFFPSKKNPGKGLLFEKFVAAGFKPEDVSALEIETPGKTPEKLIFQKDARNQWRLIKPVETRVNGYQVDSIIKNLLAAERVTKGVDVASKAKHNLDNPPVKVTVRKGADISATLSIGSVSVGSSEPHLYVLSSDVPSDTPLVTKKFALSSLFKDGETKDPLNTAGLIKGIEDFRQTKLLSDSSDPVADTQAVTIRDGKNELALARGPGTSWRFTSPSGFGDAETTEAPPNANVPPNPEINNVRKLLTTIHELAVASAKDFDDAPADPKKMGLAENPEMLTIQLAKRTPEGDVTETVTIGKPVEGQPMGQEKFYARVTGDSFVAKINAAPVQSLLKLLQSPKNLRSRDLVRLDLPRIDAIDVEVGGVTFELRSFGPGNWLLFDPSGNRYLGNPLVVNHLLESINRQGMIMDFPPSDLPEANLRIDPKSRSGEVRIWVEGIVAEKKEEPKKEEPKKEEPKKEDSKKDDGKKEEPKKEEPKKVDPTTRPKPTLKGEATVKITLGKEIGDGIYVRRIDNGAKLDAIMPKTLFTEVVRKNYLDYVEPTLKPINLADVVKVNFNRGVEVHELVKDGSDWKLAQPTRYAGRLADATKVNAILGQISRMKPIRVIAENSTVKPEQLKTWKVDDAGSVMRLTLTDKNGKATTYYFGDGVGAEKLNVYFRSAEEKFVHELPKLYLDNLAQGDLLDTLIYRIERPKLKAVRMRGWSDSGAVVTRSLELKDGKWSFNPPLNYEPDAEKLEAFFADVLAPRAEALLPKLAQGPEHGLDVNQGALQIDFVLDDGKSIILLLGGPDKDGKTIFARSSQVPELFSLLKDRFKTIRANPAVFKKD